jgi:hypothetical protein
VIHGLYSANWVMMDQIGLADIAENMEPYFVLEVGPPWTAKHHGDERRVCLRWDDGPDAPRFDVVERMVVTGKAAITVSEVTLSHHRLGEVRYAYGEGQLGDRDALLVATEDGENEKLTIRFRPEDGTRRRTPIVSA